MQKLLPLITISISLLFAGCRLGDDKDNVDQLRSLKTMVKNTMAANTETDDDTTSQSTHDSIVKPLQNNVIAKNTFNPPVRKRFIAQKSDTLEVLRAKLCVPSGSLDKNRTLSITPLKASELPSLPAGMVNVTDSAAGFRFLPHGEHFKKAVATVAIPFDSTLIPPGYTSKDIHTYYYDEERRQWTALVTDTIIDDQALACAFTSHFTDMINGIIKVPESPETQGFTPTSITDIKAANPATGIIAIAPPSASQSGAASMSYPFNLPAGRKGMQPSLALQYSSEGQSGWTGYGWSLSIPTIDIETRWGAPLFNDITETESYIVMGEQLTDQAHRNPDMERESEKQFYPRIEGSFSKIIRHGNNPENYWWEVTDKGGTKHFFGGKDNAVDESAVLRNDSNKIVQWALLETRDVYDNYVSYHYEQTGNMLYPAEIVYTGHGNTEGAYRVAFNRYADDQKTRKDFTSNGRLTLLQVNNQQLNEVEVYYNNELLRSYKLDYKDGAFYKTMLAGVTEKDSEGNNFNTHTFDYYNDVEDGLYGDKQTWDAGNESHLGSLFANIVNFGSNLSALSGAYTSGSRGGGGVMIGVGVSPVVSISAGISLEYSKNESKSVITLIDINGDGLPDKVFIKDGSMYYRPNITNQGVDGQQFGQRVKISGISRFGQSESSASSRNINTAIGINIGGKSGSVGASYDKEKSTDKIKVYFSDFNGDGLPDIANNGTVYFNYINQDGNPEFVKNSAVTPNPIASTDISAIDNSFTPDYEAERDSLEEEYPLHDIVRVWKAPYDGKILVSANVELTASAVEWQEYDGSPDGIIASIQHEGNVIWKDSITAVGNILKPDLDTVNVNAGNRLLFRLQSRYSGALDEVKWSPVIKYDTISLSVDSLDENRLNRYIYKSEDDFLFSGSPSVTIVKSGTVSVSMPYTKEVLGDDITLVVEKYSVLSNTITEIFRETLAAADIINNTNASLLFNVAPNDTVNLNFIIEANSQIDWSGVKWAPVVTDPSGENTFYIAPELEMFNKPVEVAKAFYVNTQSAVDGDVSGNEFLSRIKAVPFLDMDYTDADSTVSSVYFSVRDAGSTIIGSAQPVISRVVAGDTIIIDPTVEGSNVSASFYVSTELNRVAEAGMRLFREKLVKVIDSIPDPNDSNKKIAVTRVDTVEVECQTIPASVYSTFTRTELGHLYRGWGQFGWGGDAGVAIDPEKLEYDKDKYGALNEDIISDEEQLEAAIGDDEPLYALSFNAENSYYRSISENTYINGSVQSSARIGSLEIVVDSIDFPVNGTTELAAPVQKTQSETETVSANGSLAKKFGMGASYSNSKITSISEVSVIDLNGDRYPDWVMKNGGNVKSQYTSNTGALSDLSMIHPFSMSTVKGEANAISANASYESSEEETDSKGAKTVGQNSSGGSSKALFGKAVLGAKETSVNASVSGSYSVNEDYRENDWIDINGDGLPDMVFNDGSVRYNTGYGFTNVIGFGHSSINENTSKTIGGGDARSASVQGYVNITYGRSYSSNTSENEFTLSDINGDGLPDMVKDGSVSYNTGSGFSDFLAWNDGVMTKTKSTSTAVHGSVAYPIAIPIPIFGIVITITPSIVAAHNEGVSRTLRQIMDINGDGFPDVVESDDNNEIRVRLNKMGRTNLLKTVHRPYGATINLDYESLGNTYKLPQSKTVLSDVEVICNMPENGATRMANKFEYEDGYYDRYERDFFGFAKVKTMQLDTDNNNNVFRSVVQTFDNSSFITKNLLQNEVMTDAVGNDIKTTANNYTQITVSNENESVFPALTQTITEMREPGSSEVLRTSESFVYDAVGNVITYTSSVSGDQITSNIEYHELEDKHIINIPKSIVVSTAEGRMRSRETDVDELGSITQIRQNNTDYVANYDMAYDEYGNLTKITRPENYNGERMWYSYTYDDVLHMLVSNVTDAFGYSSSTLYDYKWAAPVKTIDLNGNSMIYTYDNHGRMSSVTAPYEQDAGNPYTIAFDYVTDADVPYARTAHYDAQTGGNIETYTFIDALMRPVQVKKTSVIYTNGADEEVMTVSGRVKYDAFGRAIEAYLPTVEPLSSATTYSTTTDGVTPTVTVYDVLDRSLKVTLPDGASTSTAYALVEYDGETMMQTTITDALGRTATSYTDGRGRSRATLQHINGEEVRVSYKYNLIGELLEVTHPNNYKTTYTYDMLGRKLSVEHPDAGLTTFEYDNANNLRKKQTANLRKDIQDGGYITYEYNYERLSEVLYPKNIYNRVTYSYGEPGDTYNRAGRLSLVEDGSGGEAYYYGKMGEVVKTVKTIMLSLTDIRTYVWGAEYDSWNRVKSMTYPDGEEVTYLYNAAGNLQSMSSQKDGESYLFIAHQGYDKYGQLTYRKAGNGTETNYTYDPIRQRLQNMTLSANNVELMNNMYSYDAVDNILGITNSSVPEGDIGGSYSHTYQYDDLNRLITATGTSKDVDYSLNMNYDIMGNPLKKEQMVSDTTVATSHTYNYLYNGTKPNAASMIGDCEYTYDENGNPTMREDTLNNSYRQMQWDEENRLTMLSDDGYTSRYTYNHGGERVIKSHGGSTGVFINASPQGVLYHDADNYTLYVSPFMVVGKDRFTKHYYAGTQRLVSKIGVGDFSNLYVEGSSNITAGQKDYAERIELIESGRSEYYAELGIPPGPPTSKGIFGEPEYTGSALTNSTLGNYDIPDNWPQPAIKNEAGDVPGPPVQYGDAVNPDDVEPGYGYSSSVSIAEDDIYFYHSDHLGSTSYITDIDANPTQFVCYMPFGEAFVDEHTTRTEMPFKFNGKEQDAETGLYYYGARYYDAKICVWYGVDVMMEKYPNFGGYVYCANNPVRLVDTDGRDLIVLSMTNDNQELRRIKGEGEDRYYKVNESAFNKASESFTNDNQDYNTILSIWSLRNQESKNDKLNLIADQNGVSISITGEMREDDNLIGDVQVNFQADFDDGSSFSTSSFDAVAGGFGNGAPENGSYTVNNYQDRSQSGWYNPGMNKDDVGFSYNLNPQFSTGRSLLRIHPDGNNEGTLGCIGLSGDAQNLTNFRSSLNDYLNNGRTFLPVNINITNNPNNNGRSGSSIPDVNE